MTLNHPSAVGAALDLEACSNLLFPPRRISRVTAVHQRRPNEPQGRSPNTYEHKLTPLFRGLSPRLPIYLYKSFTKTGGA